MAIGPASAEAGEPLFNALSFLLSEYAGPVDQKAAQVPPDADAPPGVKLAELQADLNLMAEGLETFRHPGRSAEAMKDLPEIIVLELRPFFKDRDSSLDVLYRTLAVTDYTWAARFPEPPCDARERRRLLLSAKDGLFLNPRTGEPSTWLVRLLGPSAFSGGAEAALDKASSHQTLSERDYELLRLKARKIAEALDSDNAVGAARSKLYCARAQVYEDMASAHRITIDGPIQAARGVERTAAAIGYRESFAVVLMASVEGPDEYRALGAGVVVETPKGSRVITGARMLAEHGRESLRAFARPADGKTLGSPMTFVIEQVDPASEVAVGRLDGGDNIPAFVIAKTEPVQDDLVRAIGHMNGTGAWTVTQGLVTFKGQSVFATDALLGPDMIGSAVLNEHGELAGLAVLSSGSSAPAAVSAPRLRALLDGAGKDDPTPNIELTESHNRGSASVLSAALPVFGAGLTAPGAKPLEASEYVYSDTQWGTVRGKCVANCGGGSGSSSGASSYDSGGAELGQALGKAMAKVVEALIFRGIPALFRKIGSAARSSERPAAPRRETIVQAPPPKIEKPKPQLTVTVTQQKNSVRPGETATFVAKVTGNLPELKVAGLKIKFPIQVGETTIKEATAVTDANGEATFQLLVNPEGKGFSDLDEESSKHPTLITASRSNPSFCLVTVMGVTGALTLAAYVDPIPGDEVLVSVSCVPLALGIAKIGGPQCRIEIENALSDRGSVAAPSSAETTRKPVVPVVQPPKILSPLERVRMDAAKEDRALAAEEKKGEAPESTDVVGAQPADPNEPPKKDRPEEPTESKRDELLKRAEDEDLKGAIDELYRPSARIGDGSSMDAYRYELKTGTKLSRVGHGQKLLDRQAQLQRILQKPGLSASDRALANEILANIQGALGGL